MPLIKETLTIGVRKISDAEYELFEQFPQNNIEAAERWSIAINDYASLVIPVVQPTSLEAATAVLKTQLLLISDEAANGITQFQNALSAYAVVIAAGMQPAFTGISPALPINIGPATAIGFAGGSAQEVAETLSTIIDAWFKTGIAVNNSTGLSINWT